MAPTLIYLTESYQLRTQVKKPIKDIQKGNTSEVNKNHLNTGPNVQTMPHKLSWFLRVSYNY
jgi:hypothetical protein